MTANHSSVAPVRGAGLFVLALVGAGVFWLVASSRHSAPASSAEAASRPPVLSGFQPPTLVTGAATFYGYDFQGRIMASGTPFDLNDASIAAANQWPLGTRLRLRRVPGGPYDGTLTPAEREQFFHRSIIVTVQDHGDFSHALDLSRAAFTQLGRPEEGVVQLLIESLGNGDGAQPVSRADRR